VQLLADKGTKDSTIIPVARSNDNEGISDILWYFLFF